jgi:hypothetical protein
MRFALVIVALALGACGQRQEAYPPGVEMNFRRACEARSSTPGLCDCVWEKIKTDVRPADFLALESLPGPEREGHRLTAQINQYAFACASELSAAEPAPAP